MFMSKKIRLTALVLATAIAAVVATGAGFLTGATAAHKPLASASAGTAVAAHTFKLAAPAAVAPLHHELLPTHGRNRGPATITASRTPSATSSPRTGRERVTDTVKHLHAHHIVAAAGAALAEFVKPPAPTLVALATGTGSGPIAHIAASTVTITAAVNGSGTALVTDTRTYCRAQSHCTAFVGDSVSIAETATSGNRFTGWSGGTCSGTASTCTFTASKTETDTANFA
jgi:hypothetical protein